MRKPDPVDVIFWGGLILVAVFAVVLWVSLHDFVELIRADGLKSIVDKIWHGQGSSL